MWKTVSFGMQFQLLSLPYSSIILYSEKTIELDSDKMLFQKKREGPVPIEEIQQLTAKGLSDRDVIKRLKGEGYSYDAIEKAMLQAVKQGVGEEPKIGQTAMQQDEPEQFNAEEMPELGLAEVETMEEPVAPEILVEELVEGVVEDKMHGYKERLEKIEEEITKLYARVKHTQLPMQPSTEDTRIDEMTTQLEDLEARIGGLEKAFKQFLPALTRNIESLSSMIHEMKTKQIV